MQNITDIALDRLVTVRVKGESKRLTRVTLKAVEGDETKVRVHTGRRGRPRHLPLDRITEVKVLASK